MCWRLTYVPRPRHRQGKPLNVREAAHQQIVKNEEIQNIVKIMGLRCVFISNVVSLIICVSVGLCSCGVRVASEGPPSRLSTKDVVVR